jgi:hypothetical protein
VNVVATITGWTTIRVRLEDVDGVDALRQLQQHVGVDLGLIPPPRPAVAVTASAAEGNVHATRSRTTTTNPGAATTAGEEGRSGGGSSSGSSRRSGSLSLPSPSSPSSKL